MKTIPLTSSSWPLLLILIVWLWTCCCKAFVSSQCLHDQKSLLVELKNNLIFALDELEGWNQSTDCCQWSGVTCDNSNGRVIGLDLSGKVIISGIDDSSSLFHLQFLQSLNLAENRALQGEIPSKIGTLSNLTYLNLSGVGFSGQVPIGISNLVKLVVLDISNSGEANGNGGDMRTLYMKKPNLATIIRNLTNIKEFYLDSVDNSAMGDKWCKAISSSLPHLQVLSMSGCELRGEIHKSLSNLHHLSVIVLDYNYLGGPVPGFIGEFTNLTKLSLSGCILNRMFPGKIFKLPTLRTLDLSLNRNLQGTLPFFYKNGSLEEIILNDTNFSGTLPSSISNLKRLRAIDLSHSQFFGILPSSLSNLKSLRTIDLSYSQFSGPIPSFSSMKNLKSINLSGNNLNGSMNAIDWDRLLRLEVLDLSSNSLEGPIPNSIVQSTNLVSLRLSSNKLNGTLDLVDILQSFKKISYLDLSHNFLSIGTNGCGENSSFAQLEYLYLASCNLRTIPRCLKNQIFIQDLDLSMNHIKGTVPGWMWQYPNFNLNFNHLVELEPPLTIPSDLTLSLIDLSSNNLQGEFPIVKSNVTHLDCSNNNFTSIDPDTGNYLSNANFLSFSRNNLHIYNFLI